MIRSIYNSFIICMSMYSIIPMPMIEWDEKNMKYILCFLPIVGGLIGLCMYGMANVLDAFTMNFQAVALLLIPMILSGGIHLDGLLDTCDAFFSYGDKEKKLEILKDPRTGAFGVIGAVIYALGLLAVYSQIVANDYAFLMCLPWVFVLSRAVGGLCLNLVPKARKDGLGASFANVAAKKRVCGILEIWVVSSIISLWMIDAIMCVLMMGSIVVFLLCMIPVFMKKFGGITGDLTGFIISGLELILPFVIAIGGCVL